MSVFVSKPVEIEAMQWSDWDSKPPHWSGLDIVAWVNANGGEAAYEGGRPFDPENQPRIMVRTNSGWAPVAPGWWVIKGSQTFPTFDYVHDGVERSRPCLDHYPCDPDTFAKRWEPKPTAVAL